MSLKLVGAALSLVVLACGCSGPPDHGDQRNFVFILVDDLGYMDVGVFNLGSFYETPNIDRLAQSGVRFTSAYAASPVCSPTRASIMTGKNPGRLGTTDWFGAPQPETAAKHWTRDRALLPAPYIDSLPHEETTIAEALSLAGYRTFFAGKWHLGKEGSYPEDHGFEINRGGWERGGPYGGDKYFSPYGNPRLADGPAGEHLPDRLARETAAFVEAASSGEAPFFAFLSFYSVHTPLIGRPDLVEKYEAKPAASDAWGVEGARKVRLVQNHAVYAAMVEAMDSAVGVVLEALETSGAAENTVVIFMSDNGGLSTSEGHPTANVPLRAGKGWIYEGGIREPMIIRAPGAKRGTVVETPVISTDFYPTIIDLAGLEADPAQHADGNSLVGLLFDRDEDSASASAIAEREALFWHYPHYGNQGGSPASAVRSGDWKLVRHYEKGRDELYNLADDLSERNDLASSEPERVATLGNLLDAWIEDVGAKLPSPNPAAAEPQP